MSRRTAFSAQTLAVLAALAARPSDWRHGYDLAAGGALGGAVAAGHPRKLRPARSWAAGLFVRPGS